jgi:O-antigen/teichoic acid export membrane protein
MHLKFLKKRTLLGLIAGGSLLFYAISGINSLLNYAVYPIISRLVSIKEYGEIQFLLSLFSQLAVGFIVLNILAIIINATSSKNEQANRTASLNIIAGSIVGALSVIGVLIIVGFMGQLQLTSLTAVILLGISLILNVPFTVLVGRLQGNERFLLSSVISLVATAGKLIFSIVFILCGFGVAGAILGIVVGMILAIIIGYAYLGGSSYRRKAYRYHLLNLKTIQTQAFVGFFVMAIVTLYSTADSIISRIILSPDDAGHYAVVATIAKIILAACAPLIWLSLPSALQKNSASVMRYILLTLCIGIVLTCLFGVNPSMLIRVSMSVDMTPYASLLPLAAASMTIYALLSIVSAIIICIGKLRGVLIVFFVSILLSIIGVAAIAMLPIHSMYIIIIGQMLLGIGLLLPCILLLVSYARRPSLTT